MEGATLRAVFVHEYNEKYICRHEVLDALFSSYGPRDNLIEQLWIFVYLVILKAV
jgi:hypothetical protein